MQTVLQLDVNGKFVNKYETIAKAARSLNVNESSIRKVLNKFGRTCCGFIWKYADNKYNEVKNDSIKLPKILILDIETSPMMAYVWQKEVWKARLGQDRMLNQWFILTWSAKYLFDDKVFSDKVTKEEVLAEDDFRVVHNLWNVLNEADIVIAHNALGFDIPNINARFIINGLTPTRQYQIIDTLKVAQRQFGFTYNSLNYLAELFKIPGKLKTDFDLWKRCVKGDEEALKYMEIYNRQDVTLLEEVYLKLRPWIKSHPNVALYSDIDKMVCRNCGGDHLTEYGYYYTTVNKYKTFRCECGAISRMRTVEKSKNSKNLLSSCG